MSRGRIERIEEEEYDYGAFLTFKSIKSSGKKRRARTPVQHTQNRRIVWIQETRKQTPWKDIDLFRTESSLGSYEAVMRGWCKETFQWVDTKNSGPVSVEFLDSEREDSFGDADGKERLRRLVTWQKERFDPHAVDRPRRREGVSVTLHLQVFLKILDIARNFVAPANHSTDFN